MAAKVAVLLAALAAAAHAQTGAPSCGDSSTPAACGSTDGCAWVSRCFHRSDPCGPHPDETTCNDDQAHLCKWDGEKCETLSLTCLRHRDETACVTELDADCAFREFCNEDSCPLDPMGGVGMPGVLHPCFSSHVCENLNATAETNATYACCAVISNYCNSSLDSACESTVPQVNLGGLSVAQLRAMCELQADKVQCDLYDNQPDLCRAMGSRCEARSECRHWRDPCQDYTSTGDCNADESNMCTWMTFGDGSEGCRTTNPICRMLPPESCHFHPQCRVEHRCREPECPLMRDPNPYDGVVSPCGALVCEALNAETPNPACCELIVDWCTTYSDAVCNSTEFVPGDNGVPTTTTFAQLVSNCKSIVAALTTPPGSASDIRVDVRSNLHINSKAKVLVNGNDQQMMIQALLKRVQDLERRLAEMGP